MRLRSFFVDDELRNMKKIVKLNFAIILRYNKEKGKAKYGWKVCLMSKVSSSNIYNFLKK